MEKHDLLARNMIKYSGLIIYPLAGIHPLTHNLLNVSVITDNCARADAFDTVFMVLDVEETQAFIKSHPKLNLQAYFISASKGDGWEIEASKGLENLLVE